MISNGTLNFIFRGAKTKRFHTADTLTTQTVGEHSFGVAWLVILLNPQARKELILAALSHDLAEHIVGDVSSPAKRAYPALKGAVATAEDTALSLAGLNYEKGLADCEARVLKYADLLEGMLFCIRERKMGSTVVNEIYKRFRQYAMEVSGLPPHAEELLSIITYEWEKVNGRE